MALSAFRDSLRAGIVDPAFTPGPTRFRSDSLGIAQVRAGFASLAHKPIQAGRALELFENAVIVRPGWPEAWLGLGQTRWSLWQQRALAHEGPLQPLGVGYLAGMQAALIRATELDPAFEEALRALLAAPLGGTRRQQSAVLTAARRANWSTISDQALWLDRGRWEAGVGSADSAKMSLERFVALGGDTAVGYFHLARELFRLGSKTEAIETYFAGAEHAASDKAWDLYGSDIKWIANPDELKEWNSDLGSGRAGWFLRFWTRRDVEGGWARGERLAEHYRRLEFALKEYGLDSLGQSRRRAMPASIEASADAGAGDEKARPEDADPAGSDLSTAGIWDRAIGAGSPFREYRPTQHLVDDRGVIYMRHGAPDQIAFFVGGAGTPPNVSWRYSVGDSSLIYHFLEADFDGKVGPTTLAPSLPTYMLESRCGLDTKLCLLAMRRKGSVPPERLAQLREWGRNAIAFGTTTDSYARYFKKLLDAHVQVMGLFAPEGAKDLPRIVVPWAIPADHLVPEPLNEGRDGVLYTAHLRLIAYDTVSGVRADIDTIRSFRAQKPLGPGTYLTGISELRVAPGRYLVSVEVSQGESGSRFLATEVTVPARSTELTLADVVVGRTRDPLRVRVGSASVPTNPIAAYAHADTLEVSYELTGMKPGESYDVRLSVLKSAQQTKPAVTLTAVQVADGASGVFERRFGLRDLKRGRYVLRVDIACRGCPGRVSRVVELSVEN